MTITNCGSTNSWYASASTDDGADWLTINKTYGQLPTNASQRIAVIVSGAQLHKGTYTGHILFIMGASTTTVRVTFIVADKPLCISPNTDSLEFTSFQGENPDPQVVTIGNCGSTQGTWTSSVNGTAWIGTDPPSGDLKSQEAQDIRVSLSSKQLPVGTYRGRITFSMGSNSRDVQILLTIKQRILPP